MTSISEPKILVLTPPGTTPSSKKLWGEHTDIVPVYENSRSLYARVKLRTWLFSGRFNYVLNSQLREMDLNQYNIIVVVQIIYPEYIIKYIRKKNKNCQLFYWLWDSVVHTGDAMFYNGKKHWKSLVSIRERYNFNILSFDKNDCRKYNLVYHNQIAPFFEEFKEIEPLYHEAFFCGHDKGRLDSLKNIGILLKERGITPHFEIVPDKNRCYLNAHENFIYKVSKRPYEKVLQETLKRDVIVELVQKDQDGLTWRALESIFYGRKLITNFKDIKSYDFYTPNNIFVIGSDAEEELASFLDSPYKSISDDILQKYTFKGCIINILHTISV